jgi:rhamnosyltransferase
MEELTRGNQPKPPSPSDVCAVVVTYHPDQDFPRRVDAILPQVGHVVIVDNGSNPQAVALIEAFSQNLRATVVRNTVNQGLAKALNQGIAKASELGFTWVFTLDHDTLVTSDCIEKVVSTLSQYPNLREVGIVGCNYENRTTGELCRQPRLQKPWDEVRTVITSGSLMPVSLFHEIGPVRESFFIDGLDFEYCLRARGRGYRVLFSLPVGMIHNEGEKTRHKLLFWKFVTHNHSPLRRYYIFRNGVRLIQEYWLKESKWVLGEIRNLLKEFIAVILFESGKLAKLRALLKGIGHALLGKFGKLESL